jgi:hypothetical protein
MVTHSAIVKSESARPAHAKKLVAAVGVGTAMAPDVIHTVTAVALVAQVVVVIAAVEAETVGTKSVFNTKGKESNV